MLTQKISDQLFKKLDHLDSGSLKLITPDGKERTFGGKKNGESATLALHDWSVVRNMVSKGDVGFADDYRSGKWETDNLTALTTLGMMNRQSMKDLISGRRFSKAFEMLSYLLRTNSVKGSKRNIHAHYDLGNDFYSLWLDPSMTYSSAIYRDENEDLTSAQNNKYDRIIDCLESETGNILEVGCGWGGFAERAINRGDYTVKGITISNEQHDYATKRLGENANIALEDYRHQSGKFDHIVSIEMFEAVGEKYWSTYFQKIKSRLNANGKAVIQTITINDDDFESYRRGSDFIRSYIFPGGMLPSPSRFEQEANKAGLTINNPFYFGQDYARTLEAWLHNFDKKRHDILSMGFDEGFIRLWRFYLAGCIAGFRTDKTNVMQVELSHA